MSRYRRADVAGGLYFFTVNLADRRSRLLIDEIESLHQINRAVKQAFPFETIAICVLPDHLHAVWQLPTGDGDFSARWQRIKAQFSKALPASENRSESKRRKREKGIWQRRFWEHLVRDENDLRRHVDYIHYNPVKHGLVRRVGDWPYSSFHRYVRRGELAADWAGTSEADEESFDYGE